MKGTLLSLRRKRVAILENAACAVSERGGGCDGDGGARGERPRYTYPR